MGKIRTKILGMEEVEKKQKEKAKVRAEEKKRKKGSAKGEAKAIEAPSEESMAKMEKAQKITASEAKPAVKVKETVKTGEKEKKTVSRGEKYLVAKKSVDKKKKYNLQEAITLLKKIKYVQFDESFELHLNLHESGIRGEVELPHGTGKKVNVRIMDDKTLDEIEQGKITFDILISHPSYMPKLARYAKILGPKGLMPNPKAGTITPKPEEAKGKFEKGLLKWKSEAKSPLLHQMIGKASFEDKALVENATALLKAVGASKIKDAFIKTTMSPALRINLEVIG